MSDTGNWEKSVDAYGHHNGEIGVRGVEEWNRPIVIWANHETGEAIAVINGASVEPPSWYEEKKNELSAREHRTVHRATQNGGYRVVYYAAKRGERGVIGKLLAIAKGERKTKIIIDVEEGVGEKITAVDDQPKAREIARNEVIRRAQKQAERNQ